MKKDVYVVARLVIKYGVVMMVKVTEWLVLGKILKIIFHIWHRIQLMEVKRVLGC